MNPKTANLDPNLRQAYDRVMGAATPQPTVSTAPQPSGGPARPQTQVVTAKNRERLSPILIVVAIVLFLIIYTIIWAMVFKLKIPFLPF